MTYPLSTLPRPRLMVVAIYQCVFFLFVCCNVNAVVVSEELNVHTLIFSGYNPSVRPRRLASQPVDISIRFELNQISSLDESSQIFSSVGFFVATWTDEHLTWNKATYGVDHIVVKPSEIWLPDFVIINSIGEVYKDIYFNHFRPKVHHDGTVIWSFGGNLETSCEVDLTYFPFDKQVCNLTLENWIYSQDKVQLKAAKEEVELDGFHRNGQWKYDHSTVVEETFYHTAYPGVAFPKLTFNLFLTRKSEYMMLNILTPCLLMMALALLMFWLPPDSGEKVSLGITILLAFSVFQLIIADNTPKNSDFHPVLTIFLTFVMSLCTLSTFVAIVVLYFHHHVGSKPVPRCARIFFFRFLAKLMCMRRTTPQDRVEPQQDSDSLKIVDAVEEHNAKPEKTPLEPSLGPLGDVAENLRYIRGVVQKKEDSDAVLEEWKALARVVDRFCFWVCLFVLTIAALALLCQQDLTH